MKRVLITGGAGFIGLHLAKHLLDKGYSVLIVDNFFRAGKDKDLERVLSHPEANLIEADLSNEDEWEKIEGNFDHVYHLAAINGTKWFYKIPEEVLRVNILTTLHALEWLKKQIKKPKILFTSSSEVFAGTREAFNLLPLPTPEKVPAVISDIYNPRWSYAGSKILGEQLFIHYANAYNFEFVIVRPSNFYGPRDSSGHLIPDLIERALQKVETFSVLGDQDKRTFCYITDAVEAMRMLMESKNTNGETYNIGSHEEAKATYIAEQIFSALNWRPAKIELNSSPAGSVKRRVPDISKIEKDVGWKPMVSLAVGLKNTIEWYLKK